MIADRVSSEAEGAGVDYLGNKTGLATGIVDVVRRAAAPGSAVADVFAGTGAVASAFARAGYVVEASDHLPLCTVWARARLLGASVSFQGLPRELSADRKPLEAIIAFLDTLAGVDGWVTRTYSPASVGQFGVERRYLTIDNARRVDAIRHQIRAWRSRLTEVEHAVLMTSLLEGIAAVSNVAGTYGCYLKNWKAAALQPLVVAPFPEVGGGFGHTVRECDAETAASESTAGVLYADPPYTKRQYAAYYHLLNSVASDVEPVTTGSTGLPDWRPLASDWCYKARAPLALERMVAKSAAHVVALSYSSDGHIPHGVIMDILGAHGSIQMFDCERRRYRSSGLTHRSDTVTERLYVMCR